MRHLRVTFGVAVTACAFALAATPALAHEFIASKEGNTSGTSETEQTFKFGQVNITCYKVRSKGHVAAGGSSTYATSLKFGKCVTTAHIGTHTFYIRTSWLTPLAVEYHPNGFVEAGSELEETPQGARLSGGTAELKFKTGVLPEGGEFEPSSCIIQIPEQTVPRKAINKPEEEYALVKYINGTTPHKINGTFPTGEQHIIKFENAIKGIHFVFEGEPCEEWAHEEESEGFFGQYHGSFPQKLAGGNLEFQ